MYILRIYYDNARENDSGSFCLDKKREKICKWTVIPAGSKSTELLRLMALACGGDFFLSRLPFSLQDLLAHPSEPLYIESLLVRHAPHDCPLSQPHIIGSGLQIDCNGRIKVINHRLRRHLPDEISVQKLCMGSGVLKYFFLGYGKSLTPRKGQDYFDFSDPFYRVVRFHSLFTANAFITHPVRFLTRLHYRAIVCSRYPAQQSLQRLSSLCRLYISMDTKMWFEKRCNFKRYWCSLHPWQHRALLPVLDAIRHVLDAFPRAGIPLDKPGLILLDRPDLYCTATRFPRWIMLLDKLLPNMHFIISLSPKARESIQPSLMKQYLPLPQAHRKPEKRRPACLPRSTVLLLDVDSRMPNVALMKLSRYFKNQGQAVRLVRRVSHLKGAEEVYASCIFSSSLKRVRTLQKYYGDTLRAGGSGIDVEGRLPGYIENLSADYSLYPELKDRAIGFLTRGCTNNCRFCIVPRKEGKPLQVSDLDELLQGGRLRKLILLDDNILSHPQAHDFLSDMIHRRIMVNFNQTLDIRLVDREICQLLRQINCSNANFTRSNYHFSLNNIRQLGMIRRKYQQLGFSAADNVEFICMYGYNTSLAEDVERFRFLRSLPGAYVFVQRYQPFLGGPEPDVSHFFNDSADELINELIKIVFPQNMKSMEKYYRWVSKFYALTFGKLHMGLVDTIFRYNNRDLKGRYIATLAGLKPLPE